MATATTSAPSCTASNGSITVTVPTGAGTAPFTYALNGGTAQSSNTFTGLAAGSYSLFVQDASSSCTSTVLVTLVATSNLNATATSTATSCAGVSNGSITVTPTNGSAPFTYTLNNGTPQVNSTFINLASNPSYSILVTDANGCTTTLTIAVAAGAGITATISSTAVSCNGAANGTITVTNPSGTAPHTYAIDGGAYGTSNVFTGLTSGAHSVQVKDAVGCIGTFNVNINTSAGLSATATPIATTCNGTATGQIIVTNPSGTAPHTYSLNGGAFGNSNIFTGLTALSYTVTVKDVNGCIGTISVLVPDGPAITATVTQTATSCTGVNNGVITVSNPSGVAPHQYALDAGAFGVNNIFMGVSPGLHVVKVQDANGCIGAINVTVAEGTGITATPTSTATTCNTVSNGTITITNATGVAPHTYALDGGAFASANVFTGVASGPHSVVVKDASGCTVTLNVTIAAGASITASSTTTATSCPTVNNGSITIINPTGTAPHTYALDGGAFASANVFTGVASGPHSVVVKDANGCTLTLTINITAGTPITASSTTTNASCPSVNNGSITLINPTGTAPHTYALDGGAFASANVFTGVASGPHSVIIKDANGCIATLNINVAANAIITATVTTIATSCSGVNNGQITITNPTGTAPYTYAINGGAFASANIFTGLPSGPHNVVIKDANGCTAQYTPTIANGVGVVANVTFTPSTSCNNATNGLVTINTTTGTAPITYASNPGGTYQASNVFANLAAGTYQYIVKDANGCTTLVNATITPGPSLSASVVTNNLACNNTATGNIVVTNTSGTAPYTYSLNGGASQMAAQYNNLAAGNYTIAITDASGCTGTVTTTITQPTPLTLTATTTPVVCFGQSNGTITANAGGGSPAYTYSLNNVSFQASSTFNVAVGNYIVYVNDANNCTKSTTITVTQSSAISVSAVTTPSTCNGGANGSITVSATGGIAPLSYSIDNGVTYQANNLFNVIAGGYTILVKDANGCATPTTVIVNLNSDINVDARVDTTICQGQIVKLKTASNAASYIWSPAVGLIDSVTFQSPNARPDVTTKYYVVATLGICTAIDSVTITVNPAPIANAGAAVSICFGGSTTLNGSGGVTYKWTPGNSLSATNTYNPIATPNVTTLYSLDVTDNNGCKSLTTDTVRVTVIPSVITSAGPDSTIVMNQPYQLTATASSPSTFVWSPGFGLSNPLLFNPIATLNTATTYTVTSTTPQGCVGTAKVKLQVYVGAEIYVPTVFTPNSDGKNDVFKVTTVGIQRLDFIRVYNRWGQLVFETKNANVGWAGTFKQTAQPDGTYVYVVQGLTDKGKLITKKGTLILAR